jgi:Na+/glutamate symporter
MDARNMRRKTMANNEDLWRAIASSIAFICITVAAIVTNRIGVLWWYLIPAFMWGL